MFDTFAPTKPQPEGKAAKSTGWYLLDVVNEHRGTTTLGLGALVYRTLQQFDLEFPPSDVALFPVMSLGFALLVVYNVAKSQPANGFYDKLADSFSELEQRGRIIWSAVAGLVLLLLVIALTLGYLWLANWTAEQLAKFSGVRKAVVVTGQSVTREARDAGNTPIATSAEVLESPFAQIAEQQKQNLEVVEALQKRVEAAEARAEAAERRQRALESRRNQDQVVRPQSGVPVRQVQPSTAGAGSPVGQAPPPPTPPPVQPPPSQPTEPSAVTVRPSSSGLTITANLADAQQALKGLLDIVPIGQLIRARLAANPSSVGFKGEAENWSGEVAGRLRGGFGPLVLGDYQDSINESSEPLQRLDRVFSFITRLELAVQEKAARESPSTNGVR